MRRELVILRHAKSDWPDGVPDDERPLAARGRQDAPEAGQWLREHTPGIDLVLCSTAKRTRQTWRLVSDQLDSPPRHVHDKRLYDASAGDLLEVVRDLPDEVASALLIGHNPGMSNLVALLTGEPCELKTSAIAVLAGTGEWASADPGWAELVTTATPRGS